VASAPRRGPRIGAMASRIAERRRRRRRRRRARAAGRAMRGRRAAAAAGRPPALVVETYTPLRDPGTLRMSVLLPGVPTLVCS
jgi:hypothetical protein